MLFDHACIISRSKFIFINISLVLFYQYKLHKTNPQIRQHPEQRQFQVMVYLYTRQICFFFNENKHVGKKEFKKTLSCSTGQRSSEATYKPLEQRSNKVVEIEQVMVMVMDTSMLLLDKQPWVYPFWDPRWPIVSVVVAVAVVVVVPLLLPVIVDGAIVVVERSEVPQ